MGQSGSAQVLPELQKEFELDAVYQTRTEQGEGFEGEVVAEEADDVQATDEHFLIQSHSDGDRTGQSLDNSLCGVIFRV